MKLDKLKTKGNISLLQAFKETYTQDFNTTKSKSKKKRLGKKLENIELAIELNKASISRKRNDKKVSISKKCMMCGEPTKNESGFCNQYAGSMFGCKETWMAEYNSKPTKKELNAKWRDID